ncbi:aliphatic sulfonate ABC transporter substrate-binding protein [Prauserella oleivorans]|uniref:Aliphatic sulfonate ABC transporter substrate-binding protein n=1 Tax=Prauserella oleivorans TaxID=1478153 RepID=A0ABW5WB26_9PSEU
MRLRRAVALAVLGTVAAVLAGCGAGEHARSAEVPAPVSAADLANVTLRVGDQKGGSQALLKAAGKLDDLPYRIEFSTFTSGPPLLEAASAGAVDIGRTGNTPPIFAAAANAKIAVVAAAQRDVAGDALLVPQDSPVRRVGDLRGKTIGVAKGSSAHGQLLYLLREAGLSTRDVTLSYLQPADAYSAFTQGRLDAWAVWEPYSSQARLEANGRVLADGTGTANGYTFQVAGLEALSDAGKHTALKDYLVRLAQAQHWAQTHREDWARVWSADTGLDPRGRPGGGPDLRRPPDPARRHGGGIPAGPRECVP